MKALSIMSKSKIKRQAFQRRQDNLPSHNNEKKKKDEAIAAANAEKDAANEEKDAAIAALAEKDAIIAKLMAQRDNNKD